MSTAPTGWQTPKTNWQPADVVLPGDLNRIEGNIQAVEEGSRTIDPAQAPSSNSGTLRQLLDWFANRIRAISGKTNWYDSPDITLAAAKAHVDSASAHSATSSATANRMVLRDGSGRAQFAAPSGFYDAANKIYVDSLVAAANLRVYDRAAATVDVVSSTSETALYSKTIAGGALGTSGGLRLIIAGDYLNNVGSGVNTLLKVKFGSTTLFTRTFAVPAQSSLRYSWIAEVIILNVNANSQKAFATIVRDNTTGEVYASGGNHYAKAGSSTENSAADRDLVVTAQHSQASSVLSMRRLFAVLEHIMP